MTRTAELTAKLLDDTLTDAEWVELDALIAVNLAAEAEHLALLELEAELRGLRTDFDLAEATLAKVQEAQTERTANAVMAEIADASPPAWASRVAQPAATPTGAPRPRRRVLVGFAGLLACAAALLVGLWLGGKKEETPAPDGGVGPAPTVFAKLSRKAGAVEVLNAAGDVVPMEEGGDLPDGFTLRTGGDDSTAVVELLHDKTRVEIEPDSVVRFAGDSPEVAGQPRFFLAAGQLTAAVTQRPDDRPLIVGTAVTEVFARSGTFVVSSAGPDSARVDIKHGKVDLVRAAAPKPVPLVAGGSAVVHSGVDRMDIERSVVVDHTQGDHWRSRAPRDAVFSPDGTEVWVATSRRLHPLGRKCNRHELLTRGRATTASPRLAAIGSSCSPSAATVRTAFCSVRSQTGVRKQRSTPAQVTRDSGLSRRTPRGSRWSIRSRTRSGFASSTRPPATNDLLVTSTTL